MTNSRQALQQLLGDLVRDDFDIWPVYGFGGKRHKAALVIAPGELAATDPFFLMADDNITLGGTFGEAHLHAGLETVTFMLNGTMVSTGMRLFQLWLILPEAQRNMPPRVQILRGAAMPVHAEPGVVAKVYSGQLGEAAAPTMNAVPVTLIDIRLEPGAAFASQLPASYNGFVVGIDGGVEAGATAEILTKGAVGWTGPLGDGASSLSLRAGDSGARLLLYAGQPQNVSVVAQGPFIAGSREELVATTTPIATENFRTPARCGQTPTRDVATARYGRAVAIRK